MPLGDVIDSNGAELLKHKGGIVAKFGIITEEHAAVVHVALSDPMQVTPFAVKLNVTDCPSDNPFTI
jgi:hypothetical protein